jgi:hypothetical protein
MNWRTRTLAASSLAVLTAGASNVRAQVASFTEEWQDITSPFFVLQPRPRNTITVVPDAAQANDGVLEMRLGARPGVGPGNGAQIVSTSDFLYGTFTSRLKTADCSAQPNAGVVTGFFTFFNDGTDTADDFNTLPDNSEIDMEWLCAAPHEIYLTMWTDFDEATSAQRRVLRYIDLRAGTIRRQCYFEEFGFSNCEPLTPPESQPPTIPPISNYAPHLNYYTYGFTWAPDHVRWWIEVDGQQITLWDYREDPAHTSLDRRNRIPDIAAKYLTNIWHTTSFLPLGRNQAKQKPRVPISQFIDWTAYQAP